VTIYNTLEVHAIKQESAKYTHALEDLNAAGSIKNHEF
jgi:hypothetical protein